MAINRIELEAFGIESADPVGLAPARKDILVGTGAVAQEKGVGMGTAKVVGRTGAGAGEAAGGGRFPGAGLGLLDEDVVHPAVTEVVFVGEALAAALDQLVEVKVFVAEHAAVLGGCVTGVLDPADVEGVHVTVVPTHGRLDELVQCEQGGAIGHQQAPPDRWLEMAQGEVQLQEFARHRALAGAACGHDRCFARRAIDRQAWVTMHRDR